MRKLLGLLTLGLLLLSEQLYAQRTITGKVTDEKGDPIPNVTVLIKGTSSGSTTSNDGSFSLTIPPSAKTLTVSSIGRETLDLSIGDKSVINITLKASEKSLEEVVVVGYGRQKRSNLTTSQTKVGGDKFENVPIASVDQMLQGKVAGLQSITSTGQPGAAQAIRIRGIGSISASSQPLFVVDGIQINSGDLSRVTTTANTLAGINPDDIERVDVLKDAAATAIYGSRGSNGVILITTKRGKAGKTNLQFSTEIGFNKLGTAPANSQPLGASDWLMLLGEGMRNAGYSDATVTSTLHTYGDTSGIDTKWYDLLTRQGTQQQYNISASGGNDKTTFFVSGGYFNQEAAVLGSGLKRYSGTLNIRHTGIKNLLIDFSVGGSFQNEDAPLGSSAFSNPVMGIYFLRPTQNPYNADGTLNISRTGALNFQSGVTHNPLYTLEHNIYNMRNTQAKPNLLAEYSILDNLKFTTRFGVDYNNLEEFRYNNPNNGDGYASGGAGYAYYTRYFLYDWTNLLDYHTSFLNGDLTADAKVGYEALSNNYYSITAAANTYSTDKLSELANASVYTTATSNQEDYRFSSVFSNLNLGYKGKYILSGSYRRDGSSRFGPNNKYGNFYSVGAAWNISEELFLQNNAVISLLKLRGSYGVSGNAEIGNYTATPLQVSGYNYNGSAGTAYETIGNESLSWERNKQANIGVEVGFLKDRLNLVVDLYERKGDGLLYSAPVSLSTGFSTKTSNIGAMQNKGIEVTVNATPVLTKNFKWDLSFNITHNANKLLSLPNNNADIVSGNFRLRVGQDYRSYYMKEYAGVDPNNGDPLWYLDSTKNATTNNYDAAQKIYLNQSASPKFYGGLSNSFTYKDFGITVDLTYNFGNYVYDTWGSYFTDGQYALTYGKYASNLNRWTTPGQITEVPKYVYNSANKSNSASSRYLYKGDYIRLRNLELFYNASKTLLSKVKISSLRFYVRGTNLWTKIYDEDLPFDPEQGVNGASSLAIFMTRSVTFGLKVGL